jgi:plasmid stability protein
MAEVHLKDIAPSVLERLEARAAAHRRSLAVEIRTILETTCGESPEHPDMDDFLALAAELQAHTATRPQTDSAALIREDRER